MADLNKACVLTKTIGKNDKGSFGVRCKAVIVATANEACSTCPGASGQRSRVPRGIVNDGWRITAGSSTPSIIYARGQGVGGDEVLGEGGLRIDGKRHVGGYTVGENAVSREFGA